MVTWQLTDIQSMHTSYKNGSMDEVAKDAQGFQ